MRTATAAFQSHIAGEVTTLCHLWQVVRKDGLTLYFTDANNPVVYGGNTYRSDISFTLSAILQSSSVANAQSVTVEVAMDDTAIKEADLRARLYDGATGEIFVINYADTTMGAVSLFKGTFGQVKITDKKRATIEIKPGGANTKQIGFERYSQTCRASLFDGRCKLAAASFKTSITVSTVSGNVVVASALTAVDDYFSLGFVVWKTGNNAGQVSPIQSSNQATNSITLNAAPLEAMQVGDTADVYPGCNKYIETCLNKFNNVINFRGEWAVPKLNNVKLQTFVNSNPGLPAG